MSIASRTSSRTSPHQSRAPPPADVFLENWTVAAGQCASADGDRDVRVSRARCRVHVCVVSNKNHASNSRPHARNTSNTKITSTRLVTRVTQSTRTRARRAAARTATGRREQSHRCPQCFSIRALLAIGDSTGSSAGGLYGYSRRAWLYAKTPPMQTAVPSADRYVTAFPK